MRTIWRQRWQLSVRGVTAAFAAALVLAACSSAQAPPRGARAPSPQAGSVSPVVALTSISVLRSAFNRDLGHARLVLILSPT